MYIAIHSTIAEDFTFSKIQLYYYYHTLMFVGLYVMIVPFIGLHKTDDRELCFTLFVTASRRSAFIVARQAGSGRWRL